MIFQFPQFALDRACNIPCATEARGIAGASCFAGLSGQVCEVTAQLGGLTPNRASNGPSSSSPENPRDGSQIGIVRGVVAVKTVMNELRGWN